MTSPVGLLKEKTLKSVRRIDISNMGMKVGMFTARSVVNLKPFKEEGGLDPPEIEGHIFQILGFHVMSQALPKSVYAMLVFLGCQIYANNSPFLQ